MVLFPAPPGRWVPGVGAPEMSRRDCDSQPGWATPPEQGPASWALLSAQEEAARTARLWCASAA